MSKVVEVQPGLKPRFLPWTMSPIVLPNTLSVPSRSFNPALNIIPTFVSLPGFNDGPYPRASYLPTSSGMEQPETTTGDLSYAHFEHESSSGMRDNEINSPQSKSTESEKRILSNAPRSSLWAEAMRNATLGSEIAAEQRIQARFAEDTNTAGSHDSLSARQKMKYSKRQLNRKLAVKSRVRRYTYVSLLEKAGKSMEEKLTAKVRAVQAENETLKAALSRFLPEQQLNGNERTSPQTSGNFKSASVIRFPSEADIGISIPLFEPPNLRPLEADFLECELFQLPTRCPPRILFHSMVAEITSEHGLELTDLDTRLFESLNGLRQCYLGSTRTSQFRTDGICVQTQKDDPLPAPNSETMIISYGLQGRMVQFDPGRLTAVGLSLLMWILIPGTQYKSALLKIIEKTTFRNCLVEHLSGCTREGPSQIVVIPLAWVYFFNMSDQFVLDHGDYGDFAAALGSPLDSLKKRKRPNPDLDLKPCPDTPDGVINVGHNNGHILLDMDFRLVYIPNLNGRKWDLTGINASAQACGFGVGAGLSRARVPQDVEKSKLVMEGYLVRFISFSHFVRFPLYGRCQGNLIERMGVLRSVLDYKAVFPSGKNFGFLSALLPDSYDQNEPAMIFHDRDCRVRKGALRNCKVWQDDEESPNCILVKGDISSENLVTVKCEILDDGIKCNGVIPTASMTDINLATVQKDLL